MYQRTDISEILERRLHDGVEECQRHWNEGIQLRSSYRAERMNTINHRR